MREWVIAWLKFDLVVAVLLWAHLGTEGMARMACIVMGDVDRFEQTCKRLERGD